MKVLFAVNNENISESIIKRYQQEYKEIISAKNVYYFNAIIKELQKDKTYDRIVISEDLEPFSNNNYDAIDKFIFEKMDNISDEATNMSGNDIPIILICADRRAKSEPLLVKLFGIGVYNALIGKDRSITTVCELLNRPRGKKEAKAYYRIDSDDVDYKVENEGDVSEVEIQNILAHYKKLGRNEEKYIESFDHIASQYTDAQLRLIAKFLPLNVKAVLEANCPKYQEVVSFGSTQVPTQTQERNYNDYQGNSKVARRAAKQNNQNRDDDTKLDIIEKNLSKSKMTEPVIIPSGINTANVRREPVNELHEEVDSILDNISISTPSTPAAEPTLDSMFEEVPENIETKKVSNEPQEIMTAQPKRRGRPKKIQTEAVESTQPSEITVQKRGRGRPKKVESTPSFTEINNQVEVPEQVTNVNANRVEPSSPVNLFELGDEDVTNNDVQTTNNTTTYSDIVLPGLDDTEMYMQEEQSSMGPMLPGFEDMNATKENVANQTRPLVEPEIRRQPVQNQNDDALDHGTIPQNINTNIEQNSIPNFGAETTRTVQNTGKYNLSDTDFSNLLTRDKKVVAFVGTSKNGTSFLVNNLAEIFSQKGIKTAILDLTQNKNAYYIYTQNEEELRGIAYGAISNLRKGVPQGIQVNKNLTVYTTLPGEDEDCNDYANVLETLIKNYSLILLDCDFETNYGYFKEAQEIYLVQSLDILTIQPLTAFLRDLKAKNVLNPEKIRIALNKVVKVRSITEKIIIGGMAYYNDPAMSFMTELFNKDMVPYCIIPFEEQAYSKYLEGLVNCKISLNGYSKNFMSELSKLANMVYPLIGNGNIKQMGYGSYPSRNESSNFSSSMNDTLNRMKNNY